MTNLETLVASIPDNLENGKAIKDALTGDSPLTRYLDSKTDEQRMTAVKIMSLVGVTGYLDTVKDGIEAFLTRRTEAVKGGDTVVFNLLAGVAWRAMDKHYAENRESMEKTARKESGQPDYILPPTYAMFLSRSGKNLLSATVDGAAVDYTVGVNGKDTDANAVPISLDAAVCIRLDGRSSPRAAPSVFAAWKNLHGTDHPDRAAFLLAAATARKEKKAEKVAAK